MPRLTPQEEEANLLQQPGEGEAPAVVLMSNFPTRKFESSDLVRLTPPCWPACARPGVGRSDLC